LVAQSLKKVKMSLDDALVDQMKECGALVNYIESENLYGVVCTYGDQAWKLFYEWSQNLAKDTNPKLAALFAPSADILNTKLAPAEALGIPILNECNSIINHLSEMIMDDFSPFNPHIGGIIYGKGLHVTFQHVKVAMSKVFEYKVLLLNLVF
jgi:hypothetical protein